MARELAMVLANGSLGSVVSCALAAQKYRTVMIFVETGQNAGRPGHAFDAMVQHFKPYRSHRIPMPFLSTIAHNESTLVAADPRSHQHGTALLVDLLPIVSIGIRYAMHYNAATLHLGTRVGTDADEGSRVTEFVQLWTEMAQITLERPELEIVTPLLDLELWQAVDLGVQLDAPLQLAWSCESAIGEPCGECRGCRERDAAFQRAGRADPARTKQKIPV